MNEREDTWDRWSGDENDPGSSAERNYNVVLIVQKSQTKGFFDLVLKGKEKNSESGKKKKTTTKSVQHVFRWTGTKYEESGANSVTK